MKMLAIQLFFYTLLSLIFLPSPTVAAPLPVAGLETNELVTRATPPVPTLAEIKPHLNVAHDESLFYSSDRSGYQGTLEQAKAWAKAHHLMYKTIDQLWHDPAYPNPWQRLDHEKTMEAFWDVASEAMAELSSGTVYVILPPWTAGKEKEWYTGSVWHRKEWPALQRNRAVTSVIRVNAADGSTVKIK